MNKRKNYLFVSLISLVSLASSCHNNDKYRGWPHYKGSEENIQYSSLTEVDTSNVSALSVAWEYHSGDADTVHSSQVQCNPIVVNNILYGTNPQMKLFAIDAATGVQKWQFNPFSSIDSNRRMFFILNNCRGVAYWTDGSADKRIYYTAGSYLFSLDAITGKPVDGFGKGGKIDLHEGLDRDVKDLFVTATSPPIVFRDLLIMGSRVDEGSHAAPGHIRAYDVRTGSLRWIFHTIPHPGEPGFESWDDSTAYKFIGGANAWSGFSLDIKRGIVFACTGSASYDWYGGNRRGNDLYANTLLALDAASGKKIWHFQGIHHDVWDRDFSSPPALVTINRNGEEVDAVAVTTKTGFIYLFERANGKPLFDIREVPVPDSSDLAGEKLSPTQPFPTAPAPFMRQSFTEKDINPLLPDSLYTDIKNKLTGYKHDHMYNPPSFQGTVVFPGLDGGGEWGGPSYDPTTGLLYVNANEMPWLIQSVVIKNKPAGNENYLQAGTRLYQSNCMSCHGPERKGSGNFPSLVNIQSKYSSAAFDTLIQSGRRMMPAFRQLNLQERKAVASFVLSIQNDQQKKFLDTATKKNDPFSLPYSIAGYNKLLAKNGQPAIAPPWGTLNAVDLSSGKYVWKRTLGNDTAFKNSREPTGTENYGGSVITAGGLLFIGATKDGKFRAFNKRTGELIWEANLPASAFATPAIYEAGGREYIVIACGGGKMGTKSGDSYIAFTLHK